MNKGEDLNFLKAQTCVLKVNIHCDGCEKKVKKLLQKIEGVYKITIDAEKGRVTVAGNVDPATLIKKLGKAGKHAELLGPKGGNNGGNLNNQPQKLHLDGGKGQQKDNGKPQKGKDQKGQQQLMQQMKGFKDLKLPQLKDLKFPFQKDQKNVKFDLPAEALDEEGSDFDDDDFDDDEDFEDLDGLEEEFDEDPKLAKMKQMGFPPNLAGIGDFTKGNSGKKGGGGGGGGVQVQTKGMDNKKGVFGGKNGGGQHDSKKGGNNNKAAANGNGNGGGNNNSAINGGKKGSNGKNDVVGVLGGGNPMMNPNMMMMRGHGMDAGKMGSMMHHHAPIASGHMGNIPAVQGLPTGGPPPGYFNHAGVPAAVANPYQLQYLAALQQQQQQQQQRMMMNGYNPMPPPMGYPQQLPPPPAAAHGEPMGNYFSDENPNGCSIM